ncbi:MAG: transcription antitermination factor NusB [Candidatus Moraniibacteriota bacterium]
MANRHLQRSLAMQSLFEWDFQGKHDERSREILSRNAAEFAPGMEDTIFAEHLLEGMLKNRPTIDKLIEKCAPEWPLEQVTVIDRNILRLGITNSCSAITTKCRPKSPLTKLSNWPSPSGATQARVL